MFVISYVSTCYLLLLTCVTISGLCQLTVIADKRATIHSTVVTMTCLSLFLCSTMHDAMTRNAVEKLANQSRVNCLYNTIGQSDMLRFIWTENITFLGRLGLSGTKKRRRRSVRAVVQLEVSRLSNPLARHEGTVNAPQFNSCLKEKPGTGEMGWFNKCLGLRLQGLLEPSWV